MDNSFSYYSNNISDPINDECVDVIDCLIFHIIYMDQNYNIVMVEEEMGHEYIAFFNSYTNALFLNYSRFNNSFSGPLDWSRRESIW